METARQQQFSKDYNAWNQGDVGGSLSLGNTSKFLQDLGVSEGNVYWDKAKIVASKKNHPDLTDSVMKQVPQLLDDPLLVMQSRTGAKRFAFIDNVLDDQGKPVLTALVLEPTGAGNRVVKFTKIPGGNENGQALQRLMKSGDVLYQKPGKSMSGMEVLDSGTQWIEGGSETLEGSSDVLNNANYAQKTYGNTFSADGRRIYFNLVGAPINTIDDLANAIKTGKVNIADLPVEYIIRDGNTLILNTRTSQALTQAGIPRSQWNAVNRTGINVFEEMLTGQLSRNKLNSEGISTVRPSGGNQ